MQMKVQFETDREELPRRVALTLRQENCEIHRQQGILCNMRQQAYKTQRAASYQATPDEVASAYLPIIRSHLGLIEGNILIGETFYIHEQWRNSQLLQTIQQSYVQNFAANQVFFTCYFIYPHWLERDTDGEFVGVNRPEQTKKLCRLYRWLHFIPLPGTGFMYRLFTNKEGTAWKTPVSP